MGKREDILDAALRIVSQDGIQSLTMAKIQDEAGVGSGTMYNYFDAKETLLRALYDDAMERMNGAVLAGYARTGDIKADFDELLRRFLNYSIEHFDQFNFTNQYAFFARTAVDSEDLENPAHIFGVSRQILASGQAQGLVKEVDFALLQRIVGGVIVAVAESFYLGGFPPDDQLKTNVLACCWDAVRR
ncbi:MAG: TetR/AcrR family transcriptional regulator [Bifidobacteriaceae bacterium]|jgi:AcrR family transcriptional regulator|nr:TetR/AcrR family transcriptional regulator [Bifidobacteriaceae bacterium]